MQAGAGIPAGSQLLRPSRLPAAAYAALALAAATQGIRRGLYRAQGIERGRPVQAAAGSIDCQGHRLGSAAAAAAAAADFVGSRPVLIGRATG